MEEDFNIIEYIISEKEKGKSFDEIRGYLKEQKLNPDEINDLIRRADDIFLSRLYHKQPKFNLQLDSKLFGYVLIAIGLSVTTFTYLNPMGIGNYYIIMYGPIVAGLGILAKNRVSKKRPMLKSNYSKWKDR